MSTQIFLVPQQFDSKGALVPKYLSTDLSGRSWVAMPYGIEGICLVASDPNPALAAEPDVFAFPVNLDAPLASADVTNVQAFFQNVNVPSAYVVAGLTWRTVARTTAKVFQILQRHNGLTGTAVFSTNTAAFLAAKSAAIAASTVVPPSPVRVGIAPTLSGSLPTVVHTNLTAVAGSFSFTAPDPSGTVEAALTFLGGQFQTRLVMDRGDGFSL
jgi:hypothetical protein